MWCPYVGSIEAAVSERIFCTIVRTILLHSGVCAFPCLIRPIVIAGTSQFVKGTSIPDVFASFVHRIHVFRRFKLIISHLVLDYNIPAI